MSANPKTLNRARHVLCVICILWPALVHAVEPTQWSAFQNQGNLVANQLALPETWSAEKGIAWQIPLRGYGQSTPVIGRGLVFVTSTSGDNKEQYHLAAYQLLDGKSVWQLDFPNPTPVPNNNYVSRAAPTPVVDGQGVIAFFEGGILVAVDDEGKLRWQRDLVAEYGPIESRHGLGGSLEQSDTFVFVWVERSADAYLLAVNKADGKVVWKVPGLGATSWSSPRLIPVDGGKHLVCSGGGLVVGFDPQSGRRLWELKEVSGNTTATPIPLGSNQFILAASEGRGEESNGNAAESNGLVEIKAKADRYEAGFIWRAKKATSSFGSPIVIEDRVYFVNRAGVIYCLDVKTGEELYTLRGKAGAFGPHR